MDTTALQSNKALVLEYVAAFNCGDLAALRKLFTDDAKIHGVLGSVGIEQAVPIWGELHAAYCIQLTIDDIVAEESRVAVRYTKRGTFRGAFRGQQPTGKNYELVAMEWFLFRDRLIAERWGARDSSTQARQLGM
jgi:hypothetical protein